MTLKNHWYCFFKKLNPSLEIYHIHYIFYCFVYLLPFFRKLPLWIKTNFFGNFKSHLLYIGKEAKRLSRLASKVDASYKILDKGLTIEGYKKEDGNKNIEDASYIGKSINKSKISNLIMIIFLGNWKIESNSCSWESIISVLSMDEAIYLISWRKIFLTLKWKDALILIKSVFDKLEIYEFHWATILISIDLDRRLPKLTVVVGVDKVRLN